jgi:hypothetical protein
MVAKDPFTDLEQALTRLVQASYPPDAPAGGLTFDRSADTRMSQSFAAATLDAADLRPPIFREQRSLGKRGTLARVAIAVCLVAFAIWAGRSYGDHLRGMMVSSAALPATTAVNEPDVPLVERRQIETMADLAALQQTIERLAAGQEQLTREIARLQAALRRASAPPRLAVAAPTRKPSRQ